MARPACASSYAANCGGRILEGHCYEAGSLSLPYLPFIEALRSYVLDRRGPDTLQAELGLGAAEVARIIPELRDRAPGPDRPPGDPEQECWRLFQSINDFLRNASQSQPLVLVLEDLHDADRGTLDLLMHLSRNLHDLHDDTELEQLTSDPFCAPQPVLARHAHDEVGGAGVAVDV